MKKIFLIFLLLLLMAALGYFCYEHFVWHEMPNKSLVQIELEKLGYSSHDINLLQTKLNDEGLNLIVADNYLKAVELVNESNFQPALLKRYLDYAKNNQNLEVSTIIKMVNNELDTLPYKSIYLSIVDETYYKQVNLSRYLNYLNIHNEYTSLEIVRNVNVMIDYDFYQNDLVSDTSKGILSIANKYYTLANDFNGFDLATMDQTYCHNSNEYTLTNEAYTAFKQMWSDANQEGLNFTVYSTYRSYKTQKAIYNNYVAKDGANKADTYSARAGHSEHQLGLSTDLKSETLDTKYFQDTNEYTWLVNNAYKYGFILRYPKDKEFLTGYQYEPWHWRYCGIECATYIHEHDITYDEYYDYFINK